MKILSAGLVLLFLAACNFPAATAQLASTGGTASSGGTAAAPSLAAATPQPGGAPACAENGVLKVCFLDLSDGQTIAAEPGVPIRVGAEVTGGIAVGISLGVVPGNVGVFNANESGSADFRTEFAWIPTLGSGQYQLTLSALTADKSSYATAAISVTVTGLAAVSPTDTVAPNAVPDDIRGRILSLYADNFKLAPAVLPVARKSRLGGTDPWVSTAYIQNVLYDVELFPDGRSETWATPVFPNTDVNLKTSYFKVPVCRPAGEYSILVVFLDYGNLHVAKDDLLADLAAATADANARYAAFPSAGPGSAPILQLKTTGAVIPVPAGVSGKLITPAQIRASTGIDPAAFRWLIQVDLDSAGTYRKASNSNPALTSFGYAFVGCPATQDSVNIQVTIDDPAQLTGTGANLADNRLASTALGHEVYHLFGYPASHSWPCVSGPQTDKADECEITTPPALLLGWIDLDGDGVPEILDPTPYGIG